MFIHNLNPILFDFGLITIRWYSLAYIFGILIGWWYGKKIILKKMEFTKESFNLEDFDDYITYLIISIIIGGRLGYVLFYNFDYFLSKPIEIIKIWEGGMSFHGGLVGIIIGTYFFSNKRGIKNLFLLDIVSCVAPIGIFLGRIANFINGELVGKVSQVPWSVVFPSVDMMSRHPSQLYEAFFEGLILFLIINYIMIKNYFKTGVCACSFLIFYGIFRIFSEFFREPDTQLGLIFDLLSMGSILSLLMIFAGIIIFTYQKKTNEN